MAKWLSEVGCQAPSVDCWLPGLLWLICWLHQGVSILWLRKDRSLESLFPSSGGHMRLPTLPALVYRSQLSPSGNSCETRPRWAPSLRVLPPGKCPRNREGGTRVETPWRSQQISQSKTGGQQSMHGAWHPTSDNYLTMIFPFQFFSYLF